MSDVAAELDELYLKFDHHRGKRKRFFTRHIVKWSGRCAIDCLILGLTRPFACLLMPLLLWRMVFELPIVVLIEQVELDSERVEVNSYDPNDVMMMYSVLVVDVAVDDDHYRV